MSSASTLNATITARSWNPRVVSVVTLVLVFLCGAAAGALAMDFNHHRLRAAGLGDQQAKNLYFERLQRDLNLTPAQSEQVESILNDFWQYYRTVLSEGKGRIEQVLTAEQREKFERMLQEPKR